MDHIQADCPKCKEYTTTGLKGGNTIYSLGIPIKKCSFCGYEFKSNIPRAEIAIQHAQLRLL